MNNHIKKNNAGFGLIEILLVVGVGMATFLGIEQYLNLSLSAAIRDSYLTEALYLVKSNVEQSRSVRDEDWTLISGLTIGNQYSFLSDESVPQKIITQGGAEIKGRYTVWITTSAVQRDAEDNIVSVGGTVDPDILKINSSASWLENGTTKQVTVSEYLVNF